MPTSKSPSLLFLVAFAVTVFAAGPVSAAYQSTGTRQMAERLEQITQGLDPAQNQFLNRARADMLGRQLGDLLKLPLDERTAKERVNLQLKFGVELLNAGRSEESLRNFNELEDFLKKLDSWEVKQRILVRGWQALAHLRLGEQENCLSNHNSDSCLMPIRDRGVHIAQRGSRNAIGALTNLLADAPKDMRARWLLNLAFMTVGEYPSRVPPQWLIPPSVFESAHDILRFPDIASALGLDTDALAGGVIMDDFDGDGNLDLVRSSMGVRDQLRFFHNNGDGTFVDRTLEAGLLGEFGGLNVISADYNNDGHLDIFVLRGGWMGAGGHYPNSLLRNNGNGTFDDVTEAAGLLSFHPTQTATWFDFNSDGWLDLFIGNETASKDTPQLCELFRSNGDGTFTDIASECGLTFTGMIKGVASGDFNNDGRPDLYVSWRGHENLLLRNDGPHDPAKGPKGAWKFTEIGKAAGVTQPILSFPTWFFDFDNDGWLDLFVSGYGINNVGDIAADYLGLQNPAERVRLYRNRQDGTFEDVTRASKLYKVIHTMGCNFGDLDNDGWLDFYLTTGDPDLSTIVPNRMFRNAGGKYFEDVTTSGGFGHVQKGHGVAFGDLDNDGDQDIYHVIGGAYEGDNYRSALFENPGHGGHWITLKLEGVKSNRSAIGARIKVVVGSPGGDRVIHRVVGTGGSFGCSPLRQEIGLGDATSIKAVEVTWPLTGKTQVLQGLAIDRFHKVREGEMQAVPWPLKPFKFSKSGPAGHHHDHSQK